MEIWRTVDGTDGKIEVSNYGRVKSLLRGEPYLLKTQHDTKGYHRLRVTINRKKIGFKLHRIVAMAFIPNPNNLPQVNHIDGNKDNNAANNLEWCSNKYNANHAINNGLWDSVSEGAKRANELKKRKVVGISPDGKKIRFDSVADAERFIGSRHICDVLNGKRSHAKHWSFSYMEGR